MDSTGMTDQRRFGLNAPNGTRDLKNGRLDVTNTCSCDAESRFPSVLTKGILKFEETLKLHRNVFSRLEEIKRCRKCSSDTSILRETLRTLRDLLPISEAAEVTYFHSGNQDNSSHARRGLEFLPDSASSSGPDEAQVICEKSPMVIGRLSLSQAESDLMARRATSILVSRLGKELKEIKRKIEQEKVQRKFRTLSKDYIEIEEILSHTLVRVYTMIARMKI